MFVLVACATELAEPASPTLPAPCEALRWYPDADGDGWGDQESEPVEACEAPVGFVLGAYSLDCDDTDPAMNSDAVDVCENGVDENCDERDARCNEVDIRDADAILRDDDDGRIRDSPIVFLDDVDGEGHPGFAAIGGDWLYLWDDGVPEGEVDLSGPWRVIEGLGALAGHGDGLVFGAPEASVSEFEDVGAVILQRAPADHGEVYLVVSGESEGQKVGGAVAGGDFLGNGGADAAFTEAPGGAEARLHVADGGAQGLLTVSDVTVDIALGEGTFRLASAGDTDGDGIEDLLVGGTDVRLLRGPIDGGEPDAVFAPQEEGDGTGEGVGGADDIDGDGYVDIVVPSRLASVGGIRRGVVRVYSGLVSGTVEADAAFAWIHGSSDYAVVGSDVATGHVDGDASVDLLVGNGSTGEELGCGAFVVHGPVSGAVDLADDAHLHVRSPDWDAGERVALGDLDGDGLDDLFIGDDAWMWGSRSVVVLFRASGL